MERSTAQSGENPLSSPLFAAALALLFWSGTAIANKIAVVYMDGLTAGILRSMLAGVIAVVFAYSLKLPFPQSANDRALLVVSGVSSFAIWPVLMSLGIERTTVGHAALIMALIPVFTVFIAAIIQRRLPRRGWWLGAVIALSATAILIISQGTSITSFKDGSSVIGDLVVLVGGVICSIGYVAGGKLSPKIGTAATTFWGLAIALIILIPAFIAVADSTEWFGVANEGWLAIAWMALFSSLAGYALWFYALGRGGLGRIGSLQLIMPVMTLALAAIILNEALTMFLATICAAIIFGMFLAQRHAS